jgi:uncharacterized membrane protein YfcA
MAYKYYIAIIHVTAPVFALATTPVAPTFGLDLAIGIPVTGVLIGVRICRKISTQRTRRVIFTLLAATGVSLLEG